MKTISTSFTNGLLSPSIPTIYIVDRDVRIRVEESYISGLTQLHSRAVAVDSLKEEYIPLMNVVRS